MFRKKSKLTIDTRETYTEIGAEIFGVIFSLFLALMGLTFLWTGIQQKNFGIGVFGLCLTPFLILIAGLLIREFVGKLRNIANKKSWINATTSILVPIVDRSEEYIESYGIGGGSYTCFLALQIPGVQTEAGVTKQVVWAGVSKRIYDQYLGREAAYIFCSVDEPLTFVIKDE